MPRAALLTLLRQGPHTLCPRQEVHARTTGRTTEHLAGAREELRGRWIFRTRRDAGCPEPRAFGLRTARVGGEAL